MSDGGTDPGRKLAVVLFNLGGPLREEDIRPFLQNFFNDKRIINLPEAPRRLLAWWIAKRRSAGEARTAYGELGGASPLLENTQAQAKALEKELRRWLPLARVFVAMRHWHPRADVAAAEVAEYEPESIVLLPLYPQYSTTTSLSALEDWHRAAKAAGIRAPTQEICCYPVNGMFVYAAAARVVEELKKARPEVRVLFSAHGLPEKIVQGGDPYEYQCQETAAAIVQQIVVQRFGPKKELVDWQLCYQSRVGPLKWIGPSIDEALVRAARDQKDVVVCPLAFVSEHVETLVELDKLYRSRAEELGINYFRARTVGTHPAFITGLADIVRGAEEGRPRPRRCPSSFNQCYCEVKKA